MKLRNKETGEIKEYTHTMTSYHVPIEGGYEIFTPWKPEEWEELEDVKEPLIKDEKVRKFVRAWAEVNGFNVLKYLEGSRTCELSYRLKNSDGDVVMELLGGIDGLENCKEYSITELCGEEECEN